MTTGRDLIKGSLRLIGVIGSNETPSASEETDALTSLNDILDSWSNDGLLVNQVTRETFTLVPGQQTYTIGPSGNFNTSRPNDIVNAGILVNGAEIPVAVITSDEWASIIVKSTQSAIPSKIYPENAAPLENLNFWPIPTVGYSVILYSLKALLNITNITTAINLAPGYLRALRYNLALELSPEFGKIPSDIIVSIAAESKAEIKRQNTQPVYLKSDARALSSSSKPFNWITGE